MNNANAQHATPQAYANQMPPEIDKSSFTSYKYLRNNSSQPTDDVDYFTTLKETNRK